MSKIIQFLSRRNWGILRYNSIFQNLTALMYLALIGKLFSLQFIGNTLCFFLFSIFMTGYGYFVNDLSDIDLDRLHGKANAFLHMSRSRAALIVTAFLFVGLLFAFPFYSRPWFLAFMLLWIACVSFYSLPPLRLKERGLPGLVATVLGQQTLPTMLLLASFAQDFVWILPVFTLFSTLRGVSSDISHQIRDWENDVRTGTKTFVVQDGLKKSQVIYACSLEIERLVLGFILFAITYNIPGFHSTWFDLPVSPVWVLILIYLGLIILTFGRSWQAMRQNTLGKQDPYDEVRQAQTMDALHLIHHTLPSVLAPLFLGIIASLYFYPNFLYVFAIILLYRLYQPQLWGRLIHAIGSI